MICEMSSRENRKLQEIFYLVQMSVEDMLSMSFEDVLYVFLKMFLNGIALLSSTSVVIYHPSARETESRSRAPNVQTCSCAVWRL